MATYDADLQAAVDATSVANDMGGYDLPEYLRSELDKRGITTDDDAWVAHVVERIKADRNWMIDREPEGFTPRHPPAGDV
jgi:hypothetical protein